MDIKNLISIHFGRALGLICLFIGLGDAARLVGVGQAGSPLVTMGIAGFVLLAIVALSRLFAAVGLWLNSSWGGVLLIGATLIELGAVMGGTLPASMPGLVIRGALFVGIVGLLIVRFLRHRDHVHT